MDSQARPSQFSGTDVPVGAPDGTARSRANGGAGGGNGHLAGATVTAPPRPAPPRVRLLLQYPLVPATLTLPGIACPPIRQGDTPPAVAPVPAPAAHAATAVVGTAPAPTVEASPEVIDLRDRPAVPLDDDTTSPPPADGATVVADDAGSTEVAPRLVPLDAIGAADEQARTTPPAVPTVERRPAPEAEPARVRPASSTRTGLEWLAIVAAALLAALVIKLLLFQAFVIPSLSMEPTLDIRDRVLVNKLSYRLHDIERGDVIVFERPEAAKRPDDDSDLIKRVIGLPGDTIEARGGRVLIDGEPLAEPWLGPEVRTADFGPVSVPPGQLYVLGDNRGNSADSRFIGPIDEDLVIGKAFVRWWPPRRAGGL